MMKDNEVTVYDISSPGGTGRYSAASRGSTMRSVDSPTKMIIPSSISHHVLMPVGLDLEIDDMDNYQDIRIELNATGHNLTSVLINPRETFYEDLFDDFASEQSAPLDYQSPLATTSSFLSLSSHSSSKSTTRTSTPSSHHNMSNHRSSSGLSASSYSTAQFTTTAAEDLQLDRFIVRLTKIFQTYQSAHGKTINGSHSNIMNANHSMLIDSSSTQASRRPYSSQKPSYIGKLKNNSSTAVSTSNGWFIHTSGEELRACYKEVPDVFFRADFSLQSQDTFNQVLQIKNIVDREHHGGDRGGGYSDSHGKGQQSKPISVSHREADDLSYYLDLVEVALLRQIWYRSPAFFKALDDIKGLQYQVYEAIQLVKRARNKLIVADKAATADSIRIPQLSTRHRNLNVIQEKLLFVQQVVQARNAIAALLEVEDYFTAMELIAVAKSIYHEKLSDIACMQVLGTQLHNVDQLVNEIMCNKFVSMAIQWEDIKTTSSYTDHQKSSASSLSNGMKSSIYDELDINNAAGKSHNSENSSSMNNKVAMKLQAEAMQRQLLKSLVLTNHIQPALNMYRSRLLEAIRLIVRTCVMEYLSNFDPTIHSLDDNYSNDGSNGASSGGNEEANNTPFAQRVREMSVEHFLSCLSMCFEHVLLSLVKANQFHVFVEKHINDVAITTTASNDSKQVDSSTTSSSSSSSSSPSVIPTKDGNDVSAMEVFASITALSKSCIHAVCELSQRSIAQLINIRKEVNSRISPEKMRFLWEISLHFVLELEAISGSTAYIMRQCLLTQTKAFLEYLHESSKGKLVGTLDSERWVQCDVSPERQQQLDRLTMGKAFLPVNTQQGSIMATTGDSLESLVANGPLRSTATSEINNSINASITSGGIIRRKEKDVRAAVIESVEYKVVWSVMLLSEIIFIYLDIAFNFSPVTTDVINKIVEVLRLFNTRTKQLVLGAQAIQSAARLKSISAKHLAITGQSLGVMIAQLPHIRTALLAQIPSKHHLLLTELDRISLEYSDHHSLIVAKFVNIVSDFIDTSSLRLKQYDWDYNSSISSISNRAYPPQQQQQQQQQCEYFEEVNRNISALHRVLITILPPTQIQEIFSRVLALLNRKIPIHFEDIMPSSSAGRQRILDEISHLVTAFSRFKYVDVTTTTITLEDTFRQRYAL